MTVIQVCPQKPILRTVSRTLLPITGAAECGDSFSQTGSCSVPEDDG